MQLAVGGVLRDAVEHYANKRGGANRIASEYKLTKEQAEADLEWNFEPEESYVAAIEAAIAKSKVGDAKAKALKTMGLEAGAERSDIRRAYRSLLSKYHPDRAEKTAENEKKYKEVLEAYEVLGGKQLAQQDSYVGLASGSTARELSGPLGLIPDNALTLDNCQLLPLPDYDVEILRLRNVMG